MEWTHALAALAAFVAGALFMRMGAILYKRPSGLDPKGTVQAFGIWWLGVGASTAANGAMLLLAAAGWTTTALLAQSLALAAIAVGLWGLISYVLFVYRGRDARRPAALFYGALVVGTTWFMWTGARARVDVGAWSAETVGGGPNAELMATTFMLFFLLPAVLGGLVLLGLATRAHGSQRRRILAVGIGIPAWVLLHVLARLADTDALAFLTRVVLGIAVAAAVALAYGRGPKMAKLPVRFEDRVAELV